MMRPLIPADTPILCEQASNTGVFYDTEIDTLREVLDDYHAECEADGHRAFVWLIDGQPRGFVYFAPTPMTDRTWELWWIVVDAALHGQGVGGQLLRAAEAAVRDDGGRLLLIETSNLPKYDATRHFYLKHGYELTATVPDFYRDGDAKLIYWKRLAALT
jgi:ribosomal protein S18 acetylase RimI-like enzyme